MHGRVKVKTTAQQQAEKDKERAEKLLRYNAAMQKASQKRKNEEYDDEALKITSQLLLTNPDLYTLWNFRKEILSFKKCLELADFHDILSRELSFTENCLRINPKSYGSWHHRRWTLQETSDPDWSKEQLLCDKYLELDDRNFHCWDYRYFICCRANVSPEKELEFVDKKISLNFSNYSSWHYRSKLLHQLYPDPKKLRPIQEEKLLQEFELVQNAAFTDPNDQSAWFYHRWLLGRGEIPVELHFLYVNRDNSLILAFNKAIKADTTTTCITITLNGLVQVVNWQSDKPYNEASSVWFTEFSNSDLVGDAGPIVVTATFQSEMSSSELFCQLLEGESENWFSKPLRWREFSMVLSRATSSVLQQELESCIQLQELEPNSKWSLLTNALLMKSLDFHRHKDTVMEILDKLLAVDPMRGGYYKDLKSKFTIEHKIELLNNGNRELDLSGLNLSTIYHPEYLIQLQKVDLSKNSLRTLVGISCLKCVEILILDDNCIENCHDVKGLSKLRHLSFQGNGISDFDVLQPLCQCKTLAVLDLKRNPILNLANYKVQICNILNSVRVLD